jgi:cytochrome oxidase Cu insertion factor (SCO1/SenC/PrrC family)
VLLVVGGILFSVLQPVTVLPRYRPGPGYALTDQDGVRLTSEDVRGAVTLYTFVPLECDELCESVNTTMRDVRDRVGDEVDLGDTDFQMVTIVLDDAPATGDVQAAATAAGADGDRWTWAFGPQATIDNVVGAGFKSRITVDRFSPTYAIVDGFGTIRGEYRYRTLADDADKLLRHLDILGSELRNSSGLGSVAYGAAHLFQCYP